jgi:hypothetical protein
VIARDQGCLNKFWREWFEVQTRDFRFVSLRIESNNNFEQRFGLADAAQFSQRGLFTHRYGTQKAAPGEMYVNCAGYAVEFHRQRFDCGLNEESIRQTALRRLPVYLL